MAEAVKPKTKSKKKTKTKKNKPLIAKPDAEDDQSADGAIPDIDSIQDDSETQTVETESSTADVDSILKPEVVDLEEVNAPQDSRNIENKIQDAKDEEEDSGPPKEVSATEEKEETEKTDEVAEKKQGDIANDITTEEEPLAEIEPAVKHVLDSNKVFVQSESIDSSVGTDEFVTLEPLDLELDVPPSEPEGQTVGDEEQTFVQPATMVIEPVVEHLSFPEATVEAPVAHVHEPVEAVAVPTDLPPGNSGWMIPAQQPSAPVEEAVPVQRKLYPDLQVTTDTSWQAVISQDLQPFTEEQLVSLYFNPQLQQNAEYIDSFLQEVHQDKHEFYELVLNYYRARNNLAGAEHDIAILRRDYEKLQDMVWETQEEKISVQGHCQDKAKVSIEHTYFKVCFNETACHDVGKVLKEIRSHIQNDLSLYGYEAQLSRLQVESYLHQMYLQNSALGDMPHNAPVTVMMPQERHIAVSRQVEPLRTAITILFMFQRKPAKDDVFVKDTRQWLTRLVATLLRVATIEDHVYLLNQLLRCPASVGKWAASFLQVLPPPCAVGSPTWGGPSLDHFVTLLATLLMPAKAREDLLYQMRVTLTPCVDNANENPWILVDSDGEEDEDPANSWQYLQENDIVALLAQLPLDVIIRHVLFIDKTDAEEDRYNIQHTSEACMLKMFAFASCLISILGKGLQTYCIGRYRQLNKRLGRMVRHVLQYVSDHWKNYKMTFQSQLSQPTMQRLQLEFDAMFLRAALCILSAQKLGSWQFLTDMPYACLSGAMMWRLVWGMHRGCQDTAIIRHCISVEDCKNQLLDADNKMWFEDTLTSLPTSEATYLLTTFANMACCRPSEEKDFIDAITTEIYEIAYVCGHTREFCSKPGRELLASIAVKHPFIISSLLTRVHHSMDKIGMVSLYLFKGLPMLSWRPCHEDTQLLHDWLLKKPLHSAESQLARVITWRMNWGYNEQADDLFLDVSHHRWMAVLIVETYAKHLAGKTIGGLFTEGLRQMASLVRSQQSEDQQLANWAWETVLHLQMHAHMQPRPVLGSPSTGAQLLQSVPNLKQDPSLYPVVKAIKENFAIASYVALVMSNSGHSIQDFCSEGITQLRILLERSHVIPAIKALSCVTPIFYKHADYLTSNEGFMGALQYLFAGDQSKKGLIFSEFPGPATKLLSAMIQTQIQTACIPGGVGGSTVVEFWLKILSKVSRWYQDRNVLYAVDNMLKAASRIHGAQEMVETYFSLQFQKAVKSHDKDQGVLSSFVTWLSSGSVQPSLIDTQSCSEFAWFAFSVLATEVKLVEEDTSLWASVQQKVYGPSSMPLEQAVKKSASELKLNCSPTGHRLAIYRWAHQAQDMDIGHPLLPLVWQKFFLLYLGRLVPEAGLPSRGSMGQKFFDNPADISLLKSMKKRLNEAADYYHKLVTETESKRRLQRRLSRHASAASSGLSDDEGLSSEDDATLLNSDTQSTLQFYGSLVRFYQTLSFWLDEPRLHDASLYLPALPPQYDAERLLTIFQCNKEPWMEFVDFEKIDDELKKLANDWNSQVSPDCHHDNWGNSESANDLDKTATERILWRLKRHSQPVAPPPVMPLKAPVPEVSPTLLCDKQNLVFALSSDYTLLVEHAKLFHVRMSQHVGIDCTFVELLPDWYSNKMTEVVLNMPCRSSFNPAHSCKGPAVITCRYEVKTRDDIVNRKIDENRAEYKQLMIESLLPPPQAVCSAAVHVENALTNLIKLTKSTKSASTKSLSMEVGTTLFYHLSAYVTEDTKIYPPTKQFFSSCIEILGQEYIRNNPTQSQPLLQAILKTPSLVGLLAPNFSPNASAELFVDMYEDMLPVPFNQGSDVAFSLLSKFDVQMWLQESHPPLSQRTALLEIISTALGNCGRDPDKDFRLVFEVYRAHLQHLFIYKFPDHYGGVLKLILKCCATEQLNPVIWEDFLDNMGCSRDPQPLPQGHDLPPPYSMPARELSWVQLKDTMDWLSSYFFRLRVSSTDAASFGLYPKWKWYVNPLSCFLGFLAHRAVVAMVTRVKAGEKEAEPGVKEAWTLIVELFAPWIQPLDNNGQVLSPWILNDVEMAIQMVTQFVNGVFLLHTAFEPYLPVFSQNALSLMWPHHINNVARKGIPRHIQRAFHNKLSTLPWHKFYPDIQAMDLMVKVHEDQGKECFRLVAHIVSQMPWPQILENYCRHELMDIISRMHVCLFTLLVQLGQDKEALELPMAQVLSQAESFNWNFLDGASYTTAIQWLVDNCDPKCVVAERTAKSAQVLSLLKACASFHPMDSAVCHPETPVKRVAYVRCIIQLLSKCSHLDVKEEAMGVTVNNLLTQVETIVGSVLDPNQQQQESLSLCMEVISVLNHCNPQGPSSGALLSSMLEWVGSSPSSLLLLPIITGACRCLASVSHMVRLVEGCMDAYFLADVCSQDSAGWGHLLSVLQIPELSHDQFLEEGLKQGCYLTLYAYILQRLPFSQSLADEFAQLNRLLHWNNKAKPNRDNEAKMLLWWGKILELMLRQVDYGGDVKQMTRALHNFVPTLVTLGEDKSSSGLLGAIGLGKRSQLSKRFRLLSKCLSTYLSAQVPTNNSIRLQPQAAGSVSSKASSPRSPGAVSPATQAVQALSHLESLKTNKQYTGHKEHIERAVEFISDANHTLRDAPRFFVELVLGVFPDKNSLAILRLMLGVANPYAAQEGNAPETEGAGFHPPHKS